MRRQRGQSTTEYTVLLACVIAGVIAIGYYANRAVQGGAKENFDRVGKQWSSGNSSYSVKIQSKGFKSTDAGDFKGYSKNTQDADGTMTQDYNNYDVGGNLKGSVWQ